MAFGIRKGMASYVYIQIVPNELMCLHCRGVNTHLMLSPLSRF